MTFVATLEAVSQAGGVPVVADIGETDLKPRSGRRRPAITDRLGSCCPFIFTGN